MKLFLFKIVFLFFNLTLFFNLSYSVGTIKWTFGYSGEEFSSPSVDENGIIYIAGGGYLKAINPDGTLKWSKLIKGNASPDMDETPTIGENGTVYIKGGEGWGKYLFAVNSSNGSEKWRYTAGTYARECAAIGSDGPIYVSGGTNGSGYGYVLALNPDGSLKWFFSKPVKPKIKQNILISFVVSIFVAIFLSFLIEFISRNKNHFKEVISK